MKRARTPAERPDPTVYPVEDDVGEEIIQRWICEELRPLLQRFLTERGERAFVGADQFIYWVQFEPTTSVSPDVYVMPGFDPDLPVKTWKIWQTGVTPSFALEVVADHRRKDYERSPARHGELGTAELVVFDPHSHEKRNRIRWQIYQRKRGGAFVQVLATNADRVRSRSLRCHLREVGEGPAVRIRIGTGEHGDELYPTDAERAAMAEQRAQRAEVEAATDAERAARAEQRAQRAEADAARLAAELESLRSREK